MIRNIVVYQSETGFTKKYAEWIAEKLNCEAIELKKAKLDTLADYDRVIYGGWIFAGQVSGYDKIKPLNLPNVIVFGVGMSKAGTETAAQIAEANGAAKDHCFYFEGGYAPEKLGFVKKMMVKMISKSVEKKENKTEEDLFMLSQMNGKDCTNPAAIEPLVQLCAE